MKVPRLRVVVKPLGRPFEEDVRARMVAVRANGTSYLLGTLSMPRVVWLTVWRPLFWLGQAKGLLTVEMDEPVGG